MGKAWRAEAQGRLITRDYSRIPAPEPPKPAHIDSFCELTGAILMTDRMFGQSDQLEDTRLTENIRNFSPGVNFFIALK